MGLLSTIFPASSGTGANGAPAPGGGAAPAVVAAPDPAAVAAAAEAATKAASPTSALDPFTALWENPTNADGTPKAVAPNPLHQPILNFDPAKIQASAATMDFMKAVPPETITKALGGDVAAFAETINQVVRQAVAGVTVSSGKLINQAIVENNNRVTNSIPEALRRQQLLDATSADPVFSHPAVQPLINSLKQFAAAKDPNASVADINGDISKYIGGLVAAIRETSPEAVAARSKVAAAETDWTQYMGT